MTMSKWFGRIIYTREGILKEREFHSEALANAYACGANDMLDLYEMGDGEAGCLECIIGCASDQVAVEE